MSVRILQGAALDMLRTLPDASVHCIVTSPPYYGLRSYLPANHPDKALEIGLEQTPAAYVERMVEVFRECRRVLRDDGTLWLNLGDAYEAKNRLMIPARIALAMQGDGWWLRDEVVWHKPRPTPFPANDRTVNAHEMIYLLTKRERYWFDWAAIEEPSSYPGLVRHAGKAFRDLASQDPNAARKRPGADRDIVVRETRRKRSVWSVSPSPYREGHFATMPSEIAETCILAGCPVGGTVLDPFGGAGTTGLVADRLQRNAVLIELNAEYAQMARDRVSRDAGMFGEVA